MTAVPTIAPTEMLAFDMDMNSLGYDAPDSVRALKKIAERLHTANCANVYYRFLMGKQLLEIQEGTLWDQEALWDDANSQPKGWDDWLTHDFRAITGFSKETAYGALQLARCRTLQDLGEADLKRFENLANAIVLARIERSEPERAKELLPAAMEMPVNEFREVAGLSSGRGQVAAVTHTQEQATPLTSVVGWIKDAPADALDELSRVIAEDVAPLCGDSPGDIVDFVLAAIREHVQAEMGQPKSFYEGF